MIKKKLETLYPEASKEEIDKYLELIKFHSNEKLPKTKLIKEYSVIDKQIKELILEKERLRSEILKDFNETNQHGFKGINISSIDNNEFDQSGFYTWLSENLNEDLMNQITKKSVNYGKLYNLEAKGLITLEDLPENLLIEKPATFRVELEGIRGKKNIG